MRSVSRLPHRLWLALALGLLAGCPGARAQEHQEYIGMATMLPDGTIHMELHLPAPGGGWSESAVDYRPGDRYYDEVIDHVGGLNPGESKPVRPWPAGDQSPRE